MSSLHKSVTTANVTMASANTEYNYTLPDHTHRFVMQLRDDSVAWKVSSASGQSGATYMSIPAKGQLWEDGLVTNVGTDLTFYFQSGSGSMTMEIISYQY